MPGRGCVVGVDGTFVVVDVTGTTPVGVVTTGKVVTGFAFAEA